MTFHAEIINNDLTLGVTIVTLKKKKHKAIDEFISITYLLLKSVVLVVDDGSTLSIPLKILWNVITGNKFYKENIS